MEAALRTAYRALIGKDLDNADIIPVRGLDNSYVEATIKLPLPELGGKTFDLRVCVVNGSTQATRRNRLAQSPVPPVCQCLSD